MSFDLIKCGCGIEECSWWFPNQRIRYSHGVPYCGTRLHSRCVLAERLMTRYQGVQPLVICQQKDCNQYITAGKYCAKCKPIVQQSVKKYL